MDGLFKPIGFLFPGLVKEPAARSRPPRPRSSCRCRCHTGTCGENGMVLAERALRLIDALGVSEVTAIEAIEDLVRRAGVDYARVAIGEPDLDEEFPL